MTFVIRPAGSRDLGAIVDIYNQAVEEGGCTADTEPVTVEGRLPWFSLHDGNPWLIFIAEEECGLLGWCSLSPWRPGRGALRHTAEVSYYVARECRGRGVGSRLMLEVIDYARKNNLRTLLALLLAVNEPSIALLEKHGFHRWGALPGVAEYREERIDQLLYGRRL